MIRKYIQYGMVRKNSLTVTVTSAENRSLYNITIVNSELSKVDLDLCAKIELYDFIKNFL